MVGRARIFIQKQAGTFYHLFNPLPEQSIDDFVYNLCNSQISVDGPEMIFGKLFDYVGYGQVGGLFRSLVFSRLVAPCTIVFATASKVIFAYASARMYCNLKLNAC